jgi:hypothetical protein
MVPQARFRTCRQQLHVPYQRLAGQDPVAPAERKSVREWSSLKAVALHLAATATSTCIHPLSHHARSLMSTRTQICLGASSLPSSTRCGMEESVRTNEVCCGTDYASTSIAVTLAILMLNAGIGSRSHCEVMKRLPASRCSRCRRGSPGHRSQVQRVRSSSLELALRSSGSSQPILADNHMNHGRTFRCLPNSTVNAAGPYNR